MGGAGEELRQSWGSRGRGRERRTGNRALARRLHPRPSPGGTQEGRRRGVGGGEEVAASVPDRFSRGPADPVSENVAPHCSSSRWKTVPSHHVSKQASRCGSAAGARGQRDLQVSALAVGTEPGKARSGGQERRGRGSRLSSGILGKAPSWRSRPGCCCWSGG